MAGEIATKALVVWGVLATAAVAVTFVWAVGFFVWEAFERRARAGPCPRCRQRTDA